MSGCPSGFIGETPTLHMLNLLILHLDPTLKLPANTGYTVEERKREMLWGGRFEEAGKLSVSLETTAPSDYRLVVKGPRRSRTYKPGAPVDVPEKGWYTFTVQGKDLKTDAIQSLTLDGPPVFGAKFNLKERKNAASVHIRYPEADGQNVEWFYNEVKGETDPVNTFYMACGFSRGYFGMQVNGPRTRHIIFSIWDSGKEPTDRSKVKDGDKVKLLGKGDGVVASDFGNEGTGGHSHLVYPWQTPVRQKFLVHSVKDGTGTIYTSYFFSSEAKKWNLVSSFRAPKDGGLLHGLHSFIEDFWGDNGQLKRAAEFGPVWIRTAEGEWKQMKIAQFSHDGTGGKDRFDYDLRASRGRFLLQNGGFEGASPRFGTRVSIDGGGKPPSIDLDGLPKS